MIESLFAIAMAAQEGQMLGNQEDFVRGLPAFKPCNWDKLQYIHSNYAVTKKY